MRRFLFGLAFLSAPVTAQTVQTAITALPVLEVPAVPEMGGATVGRTTGDARAFLQNPASLALARDGQSVSGAPNATWFGESQVGTAAATVTRTVGRLRLGIGAATGAMSGEARTLSDGTPFDPTDRYRALGASVATTGAVRVSLGATGRAITTTDAPVYDGAHFSVGRVRGVTMDVGALAAADIARLAGSHRMGALTPALDVTAGYAQTHVGNAVRYSGFGAQALPRTGALGWSARAGLDARLGNVPFRIVEVEGAFQAERLLPQEIDGNVQYARLGGFGTWEALTGTGTDRTTGRRGVRLTLAETLTLSTGRFEGGGFRLAETRGVEIGTAGLFALAAHRLAPGPLARTLRRADIRFGRTTAFAGTPNASTQTTFSLVLRR